MKSRPAMLFVAALFGFLLLGAPAEAALPQAPGVLAAEDEPAEPAPSGADIRVRLLDQKDVPAGEQGPPVPGVLVKVADSEGNPVGEATSNEMGVAVIPIPGRGEYTVTLDKATLPEGIELAGQESLTVNVMLDIGLNVAFPLNLPDVEKTGFAQRLIDATTGGLKFGLILALAALGLSLVYGTTGLVNFAHGELVVFGAIVAYFLNVGAGMNLILAAALATLAGGLFGWAQDRMLWQPLRKRGTGIIAMMIISIGLALALRNIFQYVFGGSTRSYSQWTSQERVEYFGFLHLAHKEVGIIVVSVIVLLITTYLLANSRLGKAMRAVSDNTALSASSGLRVDGVINWVWTLGTALSALAGVLLGITLQVNFMMGYQMLLLIFAAVTLGGLGTIWGAIAGSLIIGLVMEVGPLFGVPTSIKEIGPMAILILILLVRPQGILGKAQRIG